MLFTTKQFEVEQFGIEQFKDEKSERGNVMERKEKGKRVAPSIRRINHMMARNLDAHAKEFGIDEVTVVHGWIIRYLYEFRDRDVFQRDIEKAFSIGRSSVTNVIQLMEKKGYLRREAVEYDARLKKVVLSEKGIETHDRMKCLFDQLNEKTLEGITDEELQMFFVVMDKLEQNLLKQKEKRQQGKENSNVSDDIEGSEGI